MASETGQALIFSSDIAWCESLTGAAAAVPDRARDDAEIIEGFLRSDDDELFGVLVQRYKDRVFRLVASILGPTADAEAEDLVQEIFITVYRKLDTFRGDCSFSTWLYRLSRNRAIDGRRRRTAFHGRSSNRNGTLRTELTRPAARGPARRATSHRGFLHYWMGCSIDEISNLTEIPVGTVKSHLCRARRALAKRLNREAIDG